ncbi:sensor histidine kinase [Tahibacter amnicola]|uniref:histidine kinase n=1 Tax=Tahibacter amnicola TaxID=2976241 RepID=A0ABY6BJ64_9GAMM|nr:sensor histidine kinase [Tahibacter amnicola]UXI69885.1 ATP-binding protein [Tahibacter amnicola]
MQAVACLTSWTLAALALLFCPGAGAQTPAITAPHDPIAAGTMPAGQYLFRDYGAAQGLSYVAIQQLAQDTRGFIWIGAENGLFRYDGYHFDAFGTREGLHSILINALHVDAKGVLWAGTHGGLSHWNGQRFERILPAQGLPSITVTTLSDGPGGIWVATPRGPFVGTPQTPFALAAQWPGGEATAMWQGRKNNGMWVAQWNGEARIWIWRDGNWHEVDAPAELLRERIDGIAEDGQGRVWARSAGAMWMFDPKAGRFSPAQTPISPTSSYGYLTAGRNGEIWAPSDTSILHLVGDTWQVLGPKEGLPPARNRAVLEDRDGSVWIGSVGLHRMLGRGVFHAYTQAEGLPNPLVWSFYRDPEQRLWVGTEKGLALFTPGGFTTIAGSESNTIRSIVRAADGTMYMAGLPGNEILIYHPDRKQLSREHVSTADPPKRIFRILLDRKGTLWVATDGAGLYSADTAAKPLAFRREELPDGTPQENIGDLREDADGRLWVAGQHGLIVRDGTQWRRYTTTDGLRHNYIVYLFPTLDHQMLVGYFEAYGVARVSLDNGALRVQRHYDDEAPRSLQKVFLMGEDLARRVWIGGGMGLDMVSSRGNEQYRAADGLVGEDTANMAFLSEANGDVWFGTSAGIARFDGKRFDKLPERKPPTVELLSLRLGKLTLTGTETDIQVPRDEGVFEARFTAVDYLAEGSLQYQVRLTGFDKDFNITENRDVRYSSLPQGVYRFEVAARADQHHPWGPLASVPFRVLPAWWETWWFRALIGLSLVGVVMLVVRWRLAALQRRNRQLEEQVALRTGELRLANERQREINLQLEVEVTERRAAEQALQQRNDELEALNQKLAGTQLQLLQSEKMASVGQLAAGVAHEINTPIGFIGSNLSGMKRYVEDIFALLDDYGQIETSAPPHLAQKLERRKTEIELDYLRDDVPQLLKESLDGIIQVAKIVKDLRDFSHLDEAEWQLTDVHQGLESTLNVIAHEIKDKIDVIRDYGQLPRIECLPFQLNQVFLNVLVNAVQALDGKGRITIRTRPEPDGIRITISDNGEGISPANIGRVFEPFFTTRPVGSGTGLGLSVAYSIVQTHGGTITIESEPGQGTTVTIRLPHKPVAS